MASKLSNDDFREMLAKASSTPAANNNSKSASDDGELKKKKKWKPKGKGKDQGDDAKAKAAEEAKRYRDRALERRLGKTTEYEEQEQLLQTLEDEAAMEARNKEEMRQKLIERSKYLGGDLEHTHLVKGLDYALLNKMRDELDKSGKSADDELDRLAEASTAKHKQGKRITDAPKPKELKTRVGRAIYQRLFEFEYPKVNPAFAPGRMAFVMHVTDDDPDAPEVPVTVTRSKVEVTNTGQTTRQSTNDIVMNKLIQILGHLRSNGSDQPKERKRRKKVKGGSADDEESSGSAAKPQMPEEDEALKDVDIYADAGEYQPREEAEKPKKKKKSVSFATEKNETKMYSYHTNTEVSLGDMQGPSMPPHLGDMQGPSMPPQLGDMQGPSMPPQLGDMQGPSMPPQLGDMQGPSMPPQLGDMQGPSMPPMQGAQYPGAYLNTGQQSGYSNDSYQTQAATTQSTQHQYSEEEKQMGMASTFRRDTDDSKYRDNSSMARLRALQGDDDDPYAECYPSTSEIMDTMGDSDDETDWNHVEDGNLRQSKRTRADFETEEEYSDYMLQREALPRAAFSFMQKKTGHSRKAINQRRKDSGKRELDRQMQQVDAIMRKRGGSGLFGQSKKTKTSES